ncbi:MAG: transcriptional repressor LexA [Clostridia bacterium]
MNKKMNDKHMAVLDYITRSINDNGYSPSVRDICSATGFSSTSTVHSYLKRLTEDGYIEMNDSISRSIRLPSRKDTVDVPVVGRVAAGTPILAVENIEDTFPVPKEYTRNSVTFMLRVKGDSMVDAGILENDLLLVKQQSTAQDKDIVVAVIENEATVKTFYREKDHVRLQPENKSMSPIIVKDNLLIAGKVIGLFRTY